MSYYLTTVYLNFLSNIYTFQQSTSDFWLNIEGRNRDRLYTKKEKKNNWNEFHKIQSYHNRIAIHGKWTCTVLFLFSNLLFFLRNQIQLFHSKCKRIFPIVVFLFLFFCVFRWNEMNILIFFFCFLREPNNFIVEHKKQKKSNNERPEFKILL